MIFIVELFKLLKTSPLIAEKVGSRIYSYQVNESADTSGIFIMIRPLDVPQLEKAVSNNYMAESHMVQIDVEGKSLADVQAVQKEIRKILHGINLTQLPNGLDDYFEQTNRYIDSRRYEGVPSGFYFKKTVI